MADVPATIATLHRRPAGVLSLSPPVVAAIIDFDGGGRFQCELTDVDPDRGGHRRPRRDDASVASTRSDGVHNYFWKARPIRAAHRRPTGRQGGMTWHHTASATRWPSSAWAARPSASTGTSSTDDLLIDVVVGRRWPRPASTLADVDAFWLGTMGSGLSGLTLSRPLKIDHKPVTRVENYCATGSRRSATPATPSRRARYDVVMAIGVEKLKDSGYSGLVGSAPANDGTPATVTAPASFSLLAPAYAKKYGVDEAEMKDVLTRIAWKNHKQRRAQPAGPVPQGGLEGDHLRSPARRRAARHLRLLGRERRLGGRHHRAGRGRPPLHATTRST